MPRGTPYQLQELRGTLRPTRIRQMPVATGDLGGPPEDFSPQAAEIWRELAESAPPGLLHRCDRILFETYVGVICLWQRLHEQIARKNGRQLLALLPQLNRQTAMMTKLASILCLTPEMRSRINLPAAPQRKTTDWDEVAAQSV